MDSQLQALAGQTVPFSQEAEEAVIGAVLINPSTFLTIADFLKAEDFYFLRNAYIWKAMLRLNERNDPIDYLTVVQEVSDLGWLDEIGGSPFITHLVTNTPTSIHAEVYGRLVERASIRRKLLSAADEIRGLALNEELAVETITAEAESKLFTITEHQIKRDFMPMREAVSEYFDRIEYLMQNQHESLGLPTGFRDLDALLGGLQKSDLIIFAARPGMGKTSFLLSIALNAARIGQRVGIFTMEMGVEQLVQRLISMETGINSQRLRAGQLGPQEYSRFVEAAGRVSNFPIYIDDTPALNPMQMRTKCRRLQHEHGVDLILLDYVQLMNSGKAYENNRVQEVSYISRNLKELAREINVPLLTAAQLSRAVEQRQDKRPVLSDLRESGSLEQDSDIVMFLYRDSVYNEATEFPNQADIIIAKHRNGPTGAIALYFERSITKFLDAAVQRVDLGDD
jgi:replicative DNA helicase